MQHHLICFRARELLASFGEVMSPSPSVMVGPTELAVVQIFCFLERVWCDSVGIMGLFYNLT